METIEIARRAVESANERQAQNIELLDVRGICSFSDYFVICSGETDRQIKAIYEEIEKKLNENKVSPLHQDGAVDSGWLILDYGSVVIHIFSPTEREYYQLEEMWKQAKTVVKIQ